MNKYDTRQFYKRFIRNQRSLDQNYSFSLVLRNLIILVKISPVQMKKLKIMNQLQSETVSQTFHPEPEKFGPKLLFFSGIEKAHYFGQNFSSSDEKVHD